MKVAASVESDNRGWRGRARRDQHTDSMVYGITCTLAVVISMELTCALLAVSLSGLSVWSSSIALMPSGVAASPRPCRLAAIAENDRAGGRMFGWNIGEKPAQHRPQHPPQHRHEAGCLRHAHHPEPERHDADEADGDRHGGGRRIDRALRDAVARALHRRHDQGNGHETEPDVIEHGGDGSVATHTVDGDSGLGIGLRLGFGCGTQSKGTGVF